MSEVATTMIAMNELENQIRLARTALECSQIFEQDSGYDVDATMDRKYNEGFLEALEFVYILQNGYAHKEQDND